MFTAKVVQESYPNPDMRSYHVNFEISQYPINDFERPLRVSSMKYLDRVGERGTALLKALFAIPGVDRVFIKPYEISVTKGKAFDWQEIEPGVMRELYHVAPSAPKELEKENTSARIPLRERFAQMKVSFQSWLNRALAPLKESLRRMFSRK